MSDTPLTGLQYFDPKQDHTIAYKRLPHWAQAGTVCFITWRTADSLPKEAIARLSRQRLEIFKQFQIRLGIGECESWNDSPTGLSLARLPPEVRAKLHWSLFTAWDEQLDHAAGACVLREPELSQIVMNSLRHFDNDRYVLTDAVVMPNHVHLLVAFRDEDSLITQCTSWKRFTATQINRWLRTRNAKEENLSHGMTELRSSVVPRPRSQPPLNGEFWQVEQFDHLVRSPEEFDRYRRYIAENPGKARLPVGSFRYLTKGF